MGDAQETSDLRCPPPLPARTLLSAMLAGALRRGDDQVASDLRWLPPRTLLPAFDDPNDALARSMLAEQFPGREIRQVPGREILYGGGNVHCITQQQPSSGG